VFLSFRIKCYCTATIVFDRWMIELKYDQDFYNQSVLLLGVINCQIFVIILVNRLIEESRNIQNTDEPRHGKVCSITDYSNGIRMIE